MSVLQISKEVAQHMPNTSNSEDDLRQQLELFESVKYFEVDDVIDPREADLSIQVGSSSIFMYD